MISKVRMSDVAKHAGVSQQTVSRVLSGHPSVRTVTRNRVQEAISHLGYAPNLSARVLATGDSNSVGILVVGSMHHGIASTFSAVERHQRQQGRYLLSASVDIGNRQEFTKALSYLRGRQVLATVVVSHQSWVLPALTGNLGFPLVLIMSGDHNLPNGSRVSISQQKGTRMLMEHLLEQGYTDIVHVTGDLSSEDAIGRMSGFERICREHGLTPRLVAGSSWGCEDGYRVGQRLAQNGVPEAIFAANDSLAIGIMRALYEVGKVAGRDYAITGFDDIDPAGFTSPSLTTVRQPWEDLAILASQEVTRLLDGHAPGIRECTPELIIRESSILPKRRNGLTVV